MRVLVECVCVCVSAGSGWSEEGLGAHRCGACNEAGVGRSRAGQSGKSEAVASQLSQHACDSGSRLCLTTVNDSHKWATEALKNPEEVFRYWRQFCQHSVCGWWAWWLLTSDRRQCFEFTIFFSALTLLFWSLSGRNVVRSVKKFLLQLSPKVLYYY